MTGRIPESELILTPEGRIYHLNLHPEMVADTIIVVGDPDRVPKVSSYFDKIEFQVSNRELVTHTGTVGGKRISVISSGMGTDNVELLMTELDALVNVDFKTRQVKEKLKKLRIFRIGTSGCFQKDTPLDVPLVSTAALGLDSLMNFYQWSPLPGSEQLLGDIREKLSLDFQPYLAMGSESLLSRFDDQLYKGITITAPGFYAPQGRELRLEVRNKKLPEILADFKTPFGRFTNLEMETAGYYAMAKMLGHDMISLNALIANRARREFSGQAEQAVDNLIRLTLSRL